MVVCTCTNKVQLIKYGLHFLEDKNVSKINSSFNFIEIYTVDNCICLTNEQNRSQWVTEFFYIPNNDGMLTNNCSNSGVIQDAFTNTLCLKTPRNVVSCIYIYVYVTGQN